MHGDSQIVQGSVGWDGVDDYFFLGTDDNDGHTFVRVQLFTGRDVTKPLNPARAQGTQIICHLSGGMFRIPPKDTLVFVAIPKGMETCVGAGVIFASIEKSPSTQFDQDRVVMDFGPDTHVVIKGKSVVLQDTESPSCFVGVGTPRGGGERGIYGLSQEGAGFTVQGTTFGAFSTNGDGAQGVLQLTSSEASFTMKGVGLIKFKSGSSQLFAAEPLNITSPMVLLGPTPAAGNAAVFLLSGAPAISGTVFLSP